MKYSPGETETVFLIQGTLRFGYEENANEISHYFLTFSLTWKMVFWKWISQNRMDTYVHPNLEIENFYIFREFYQFIRELASFSVMHMLVEEWWEDSLQSILAQSPSLFASYLINGQTCTSSLMKCLNFHLRWFEIEKSLHWMGCWQLGIQQINHRSCISASQHFKWCKVEGWAPCQHPSLNMLFWTYVG